VGKDNDFFTIYFQIEDESKFKDFQVGMVILISNEKFHSMFHEVKNDSHCTGVITSSDPSKCQVKVTISQEHGDEYLISNFSKVSSDAANFRVWAVLSEKFTSGFYCYVALHAFEEVHEVLLFVIIFEQFTTNLPILV
tara:strand:+ start:1212 stop:1625 length:414 start_codon:yes stop_codon:yes gene_type:complete